MSISEMNFLQRMLYILEQYSGSLAKGAATTMVIAIVCTALGCVIGFAVGIVQTLEPRKKDNIAYKIILKVIKLLLTAYVEIFRGTPMMLQAAFIYYGASQVFGLNLGMWQAAILIVSINTGAYIAETFRGGILSVDIGQTEGAKAIGMSGIDCGLLRSAKVQHPKGDLGCVGEIVEVQTAPLLELLSLGYTPVISPISLGADGRSLNVNADHAALAIARALQVQEAIFLTNVPGVLVDGQVMAELSSEHAQQLIEAGHITGGMIPKVQSALQVIACGVQAVRITNLEGLAQASGTRVSA